MPRIGNQRHMRVRPRRRIGSINPSKNRQGFLNKIIEATALASLFLVVYIFAHVVFVDNPPANTTILPSTVVAAAAGDHYSVVNSNRFTLDIPASPPPPPPPPPPHTMLRGPRKQSNEVTSDDSNGSAINGVTKAEFSLLEGEPLKRKRGADIVGIQQGNDEAMKAAQAAVEAERAAVMAVMESSTTLLDAGWEGEKAWDESVMGENAS